MFVPGERSKHPYTRVPDYTCHPEAIKNQRTQLLSVHTRVSITGLDQMDGSGSDLMIH